MKFPFLLLPLEGLDEAISHLHEQVASLPIEAVQDRNFKINPPFDEELGKLPLDWKKILDVDDLGDTVTFKDAPDEKKPCLLSENVEPGSNAHDGEVGRDKPVGNHKRVRKRCARVLPLKERRETSDVKDTIDDILSFYKEVDGLNHNKRPQNKFKRSFKQSQTNLKGGFHFSENLS